MAGQHPLQRLQDLINLERQDIVTLLSYGLGIGLLSLTTPIAVQALVNTIAFGALMQPLIVLTLILLVLLSLGNGLVALQFYVVEMLQRRLFIRLFGETVSRLQHSSFETRDNNNLTELVNNFFDVVSLQKSAASLLLETLGYFLQTLIGMGLLAFYHPILLAFDLFLISILYVILFVLGKNGIKTAIEQSKAKYIAVAWLENIASNPLLGKSQLGEEFLNIRSRQIAEQYLTACIKHFQVLSRQNLGALILHTFANSFLLGIGGWMVIERQLSLGQLIAAELVVNAMIYGLTRLGKTLDNFYELVASIDKIGYLQDLPQEMFKGNTDYYPDNAFEIHTYNLTVNQSHQTDQIHDLNLSLSAGDNLVISEGADRGTLLDVLFGLRSPTKGRIHINQHDMRDLSLGNLRNNVCLVRDAEVMNATIYDNVNFGRNLSITDIRTALEKTSLFDKVSSFPEGLDTELCSHGEPLNQDEQLRLTLARAIAGNPKLLMIDRTLDRIDSPSLSRFLDAFFIEESSTTLIVISHNPKVIERCKRHAYFSDGKFVEVIKATGASYVQQS